MTEKRFNVFDVDGTIFLEDHKEGSYHIGEIGNVDVNCLNDIADRLNELHDENKELKKENDQLKQQLKTKVIVNRQYEELQRVKKENEQLKKEVEDLKQALIRCAFDDK